MPRRKIGIIFCVAVSLLALGFAVISSKNISKGIGTWLNTPFDPAGARERLKRNLIRGKLTKIYGAVTRYTIQNNLRLPPMNNPKQVQLALLAYTNDTSILLSPVTHHQFQPNGRLSSRKVRDFTHPSQVVAFYDVHPPDPGYDKNQPLSYPDVDILFLDGRISTVSTFEWPKYRLASKIP